jgi:hypothetical protein
LVPSNYRNVPTQRANIPTIHFFPAAGKLTKGAHFLLELVRIIFVEK